MKLLNDLPIKFIGVFNFYQLNHGGIVKINFLLFIIGILFVGVPVLNSEPTYNGTAPGCAGSGCHSFQAGIVSVVQNDLQFEVTLQNVSSADNVAGEMVNSLGEVVDVIVPTTQNPFTLTAPDLGTYTINVGYKKPNRSWDSIEVNVVPLPVELVSFTALSGNENIILNWVTATELNNYGFEIQRKNLTNQSDFLVLAFIDGFGTTSTVHNYKFTDNHVIHNTKYVYRLKQIDLDGVFDYSSAVEINFVRELSYKLAQNYPNPFNPSTEIEFQIPEKSNVTLEVYSILGKKITTLISEEKPSGEYNVEFNADSYPSGVYLYKLQAGVFVESKKMVLIK